MSEPMLLLWLVIGHIVGDYYLQPKRWVDDRNEHNAQSKWLLAHVAVHGALTGTIVALYIGTVPATAFAVLAVVVTHFVMDVIKSHQIGKPLLWLLIDQAVHLLVLFVLWALLTEQSSLQVVKALLAKVDAKFITIFIGYLLVLKPASVLIATMLDRWSAALESNKAPGETETNTPQVAAGAEPAAEPNAEASHSLESAGEYIGYMERGLIVTFILANQLAGVGFVLAAKSVFRFGDLRDKHDRRFTEYVMAGTFASISIAFVVGLIVALYLGINIQG